VRYARPRSAKATRRFLHRRTDVRIKNQPREEKCSASRFYRQINTTPRDAIKLPRRSRVSSAIASIPRFVITRQSGAGCWPATCLQTRKISRDPGRSFPAVNRQFARAYVECATNTFIRSAETRRTSESRTEGSKVAAHLLRCACPRRNAKCGAIGAFHELDWISAVRNRLFSPEINRSLGLRREGKHAAPRVEITVEGQRDLLRCASARR